MKITNNQNDIDFYTIKNINRILFYNNKRFQKKTLKRSSKESRDFNVIITFANIILNQLIKKHNVKF